MTKDAGEAAPTRGPVPALTPLSCDSREVSHGIRFLIVRKAQI